MLVESLTVTVVVRAGGLPVGLATDLSVVPGHPRCITTVLAGADYSGLATRPAPPAAPFPVAVRGVETWDGPALPLESPGGAFLALEGGRDGLAALRVADFVGTPFPPGAAGAGRGLRAFERLDEPACLAIPDVLIRPEPDPAVEPPPVAPGDPCAPCPGEASPAPPRSRPVGEAPPMFDDAAVLQVQQALVEHCEARRDRMALLAPPLPSVDGAARGVAPVQAWRAQFDSRHAALYAPWLQVSDPIHPGELRAIPACGHVAGQYALADASEGVHRAPANRDLAWTQGVTLPVRDAEHGLLNAQGINVIRPVLGRALRIMGARTVSSDPVARYVPVRRLIMMLLRSFDRTTQWATFEPNDHRTRSNLAVGFGNFLLRLWGAGALAGTAPEQAFAVRCDESNNPPAARDNGQLFCDIAIAPVAPLEFVVLRIGRVDGELEVQEQSVSLREAAA
jgi:hypothetical protein